MYSHLKKILKLITIQTHHVHKATHTFFNNFHFLLQSCSCALLHWCSNLGTENRENNEKVNLCFQRTIQQMDQGQRIALMMLWIRINNIAYMYLKMRIAQIPWNFNVCPWQTTLANFHLMPSLKKITHLTCSCQQQDTCLLYM